jgi:hypothetical protein
MLFRETVAVYCENHKEHTNTLCGQNAELLMLKEVVHMVTIRGYLKGKKLRVKNFKYGIKVGYESVTCDITIQYLDVTVLSFL